MDEELAAITERVTELEADRTAIVKVLDVLLSLMADSGAVSREETISALRAARRRMSDVEGDLIDHLLQLRRRRE